MMKTKPLIRTITTERATVFALILACLLMIWAATEPAGGSTVAYDQDNLIRLHVIANSDDAADQRIKLAVRDAVASYLEPALASVGSRAAAAEIIQNRLTEITAVADRTLAEGGVGYGAEAIWGRALFPTRSYADLVVPAGEYDSLRIVLGSGKGRNWWCVLFPPLCFIDLTGGFEPDTAVARAGLSDAQVKLVAGRDPAELPPVIRSKLVELIARAPSRLRALARWLAGADTPQRWR